jgi:hypothetical protein
MKQIPRFEKTPAILPGSVHQRLSMYALAASAAGVGALALAQPAEARIVYKATHVVVGRNGRYKLDLNHDKIADFILVNTYGCNTDYCVDALSAIAAEGNGVEGAKGFLSIPYAFALQRGALIGPHQPFSGQLMASSQSGQGTLGRWLNVTNHYLGLKFKIKGKIHYGWARLTVQVPGGALIKATLTGYAYETIAGKSIIAGKTKGPDEIGRESDASFTAPTPRSASLGLLALGSQRLSIPRRKESPLESN